MINATAANSLTHTVLEIALPVPRGEAYDYLAPEGKHGQQLIGCRVEVRFGRRVLHGLVVNSKVQSEVPADKLKAVARVLDNTALCDQKWLDLLAFTSRYYHSTLGMSIATAIPSALRQGKKAQGAARWQLSESGLALDDETLKKRPAQYRAWSQLAAGEALTQQELDVSAGVIKTMREQGWICAAEGQCDAGLQTAASNCHPLNEEQAQVVEQIQAETGFHSFLLQGITGSGKTEVYLSLAREHIAQGKQVLLLVPEIGLTPQMLERVAQGTGARVVALHSGLSDGERLNNWLAAARGDADIVLGTRSAVFCMLQRPGLIIVDEEHDHSFKQQDGLRYHARDLAVWRAQQLDVPIVLGSATPSLESLHNVQQQRYTALKLSQRHGKAGLPALGIIDMRQKSCPDGLSDALIQRINHQLEQGSQVLLFLNRRGFSPVLLCHDCGWSAFCERCDARLVSHKPSHSLRCHHCGHQRRMPKECPDCDSPELRYVGQGTQRVEEALQRLWPQVPSLRIDRDILSRKGQLEDALARIRSGEIRLIIGTQMLAKGHDFPQLGLVGIVDADQGLYGNDFRATEHFAQLLIQVAGRAGRRDAIGEVCLQTHQPEHALIQALKHGDYEKIAMGLMSEREMLMWPPYSRLSIVRAEANQASLPMNLLNELCLKFSQQTAVDILGPVPAVMERRAGHYRYQLLLRSQQRSALQQMNRDIRRHLEQSTSARKIRWSIDVDPQFLD